MAIVVAHLTLEHIIDMLKKQTNKSRLQVLWYWDAINHAYGIAKITKHIWYARAPYSIYNTNHKGGERERKTIEAR